MGDSMSGSEIAVTNEHHKTGPSRFC